MALKVKLAPKDEQMEETDNLPDEVIGEEIENADVVKEEDDDALRLKLENAEMKGKLSVLQAPRKNLDTNSAFEQQKAVVFRDINTVPDDQFEQIYKMTKNQASMEVLNRENALTKAESKRLHAESEAKSEMGAKYGTEFYKYKREVEEAMDDMSEVARLDPERVQRFMETKFLALRSAEKPVSRSSSNRDVSNRRQVVSDFEKPTPLSANDGKKKENSDEILASDRDLAKNLGLTSEKERQQYMTDFVPMDMGGGKWFKDPSRGFEKIDAQKV